MPAHIKLLLDEDTHLALAEALRRRGHDAVHVREVARLGLEDQAQLDFAIEQKRCFVTFNRGEFVSRHGKYVSAGREHFGIVVSTQRPVGQMLRALLTFLQTHTPRKICGVNCSFSEPPNGNSRSNQTSN